MKETKDKVKLLKRKKNTLEKIVKLKKNTNKAKASQSAKIEVTPYREILFSDGHGFFIRTTCNLTSDDRVQVTQYREHEDAEGTKFLCTEPNYFEDKKAFLDWLLEMLRNNFDEIPFITITPVKASEVKKYEREATDAMYG